MSEQVKKSSIQPISLHWSLSMPPKNIGKLTTGFLILSGDIERDQWHEMNSENVGES